MSTRVDNTAERTRIALSMGDPFGIGPEIIVRAIGGTSSRLADPSRPRLVIFGSERVLAAAARSAGIVPFWKTATRTAWLGNTHSPVDVLLVDDPAHTLSMTRTGASAEGGAASFQWVEDAIAACTLALDDARRAHAIVTAPISKTSWHMAGLNDFPGHTELLANRFHSARHGMLFVGPSLRVMLVTIHVPLMRVASLLTREKILDAIELAHRACVELGVSRPRVAVCGLNPHAGEGGLIGHEDEMLIAPAIRESQSRGQNTAGPLPADTLFNAAALPPFGKGAFDCVVAMYHDQGLIPAKLLDGMKTVNVTVGLPVPRTSPAHGTAFDIAGKGIADPESMHRALELAAEMIGRSARTR